MADNVAITAGSGTTIATDDIGGVQYQRVKVTWGPDATANDTDAASGKALPVQVRSATNLIPLGEPTDAKSASTDTTSVSIVSILKQLSAYLAAALAVSQSGTWTVQPGNTANTTAWKVDGSAVNQPTIGIIANPTSTYTRPSDTTAYAANDLVSNNVTAGSITVQSFTAARVSAGSGMIRRLRLNTNHTTGLSGITFQVRLWSAAPTYTNGDNGAYAVSTGAAGFLGSFLGTFEQQADGAYCVMSTQVGDELGFILASGQSIFWDMQTLVGFTPQSGKTFTITAEVLQN